MAREVGIRPGGSKWLRALLLALTATFAALATPAAQADGFSPVVWTQQHPLHSPPGRWNPGLAYDAATGQAVLYGGYGEPTTNTPSGNPGVTFWDDTWTWDGHDWSQACSSCGPGHVETPTNEQAPMAYDPGRHQIVMWVPATYDSSTGGLTSTQSTWIWSGSGWTQACSMCFSPNTLDRGSMAYDPILREVVMYIAYATDGTYVDTTYGWNGSSWSSVGSGAHVQGGIAAATDGSRNRVVMYTTGGSLEWNGSSWTADTGTQPTPGRFSTAMAYDPASQGVILMGGSTEGSAPASEHDTWLLKGGNWSTPFGIGGPGTRENEGLADGSTAGQGTPVLLFGGEDGAGNYLNDTWTLSGEQFKIARATLDFEARAQRRLAKMRELVKELAPREKSLEQQILTARDEADKTAAGAKALEAEVASVDGALASTLDALQRLRRSEEGQPASERGLFEAEDRYSTTVSGLEQQILDGQLAGADVSGLEQPLRLARNQLASVQSILTQKLAGTPTGDLRAKWLGSLRALETRSFSLHDSEAQLLGRQRRAEAKLTALADELGPVYIQLLDIGERLTGFDPEVRAVSATVSGQTVFHAAPRASYAQLLNLNQQIADQHKLVLMAAAAKEPAFASFKAAEQDAIASQKHLAEVMLQTAYGKFATDLAFDTYDVVKATAKGGVVGALAELGKKAIEKGLFSLGTPAPSGFEEGAIEAQVNAAFKADLKDSFSQPQITKLVAQRVVKDTLLKASKDGLLNKYIGSAVYKKAEFPFRQLIGDSPVTPGELFSQLENNTLKINRIDRLQTQLKDLKKGYLQNFASSKNLKKLLKGEAENFAKDALKTVIKGLLESRERDAWVDFFIKDAFARAVYSPYHQLAGLWEDALVREDELLATKAELLKGVDPRGGLVPSLSTGFPRNAQIEVTLELSGYRDPGDPVQVFVGGARAQQVGDTDTYTVAAKDVTPDADGGLTILLK